MDTQFNTLHGCRSEVVVTLTPNDLEPHYKRAYREAQPELEVKGFRKGKVPLDVIKKRFGKRIRANAMGDITSEVFSNIVRTNEIKTIGRPVLSNVDEHSDGSVQFTIEYDVQPEFELADYKNFTVQRRTMIVNDDVVDSEIDRLLLDHGKFQEAEQITSNNFFVTVEAQKIDDSTGQPDENAPVEELRWFLPNPSVDADIKAKLLNLKVGDTFVHEYPSEKDRNLKVSFLHTVKEFNEVVPAELTNDFVEGLTNGAVHSTEELRRQIESQLRDSVLEHTDKSIDEQIIRTMLNRNQGWAVPQALVDELSHASLKEFKDKQPDKKLPPNFSMATFFELIHRQSERSARWLLVRDAIIEKEKLEATEADIDAVVEKIAAGANLDPAQIRSFVADDERFMAQIVNDKAMSFLRDQAGYEDVEVATPNEIYLAGDDEPVAAESAEAGHEGNDESADND